ncbi:MAG: FAD-dependent oxidoreductase, partial [Desulfobacterales bacterium]
TRPAGFDFQPGQRIALTQGGVTREYSLASAPGEADLTLCIGVVAGGRLSPRLARLAPGALLEIEGPWGHFLFQPSRQKAVFIAGGTGVAPFRAMAAQGHTPALLIQGAPNLAEAYYQSWFGRRTARHVLCLSAPASLPTEANSEIFAGRVTDFMARHLPPESYDFYLCGGPLLVRDTMALIDERFPQSRVRSELFD